MKRQNASEEETTSEEILAMETLEKAQRMLEKHALCNHCLGRQFALLGHGLDNQTRGETLKLTLTMRAHQLALLKQKAGFSLLRTLASNGSFEMAADILKRMKKETPEKQQCHLCGGRFNSIAELAHTSFGKLLDYEYKTFLIGVELPAEVEEREDEFKAEFEVKHGESMRNHFSREIGKQIAEITRKTADYKRPDVVVLVNPFTERATLQVNPLCISGRYRKLVRGIPQSRWICAKCRGRGCPNCNWTGKMYPESVEEIVGTPTLEKTGGEETAFHGAGREDIDARMLGRGRPFVIEVKKPKRRSIDLSDLAETINKRAESKVKVSGLRFANRDMVRRLKRAEAAQKMYRAIVGFNRRISDEEIALLEKTLTNAVIRQQTPRRVMHRRADITREKHIYEAKVKRLTPNRLEVRVRCQGGLYIKELITGDDGRTIPSVSKIVDAQAKPLELDVLSVLAKEET